MTSLVERMRAMQAKTDAIAAGAPAPAPAPATVAPPTSLATGPVSVPATGSNVVQMGLPPAPTGPSTSGAELAGTIGDPRTDIVPALAKTAPLKPRVYALQQQLAVCATADEPKVLKRMVDLMTEALAMEHEQVGTDWTSVPQGDYDIPLLGSMLTLVAERYKKYAPQVIMALFAEKSPRLLDLSDQSDARPIGHIIAAAAQVIADQQFRESTTAATRSKRANRKTAAENLLAGATVGLDLSGDDENDPFAAMFATEMFPASPVAEVPNGLSQPEPLIETNGEFGRGTAAPTPPARESAVAVLNAAGATGIDFSTIDDGDDDEDDPFDGLD